MDKIFNDYHYLHNIDKVKLEKEEGGLNSGIFLMTFLILRIDYGESLHFPMVS